jgi:hypothetical protein
MQNRSAKKPDEAKAQQEPHSPYSSISPMHSGAYSNQLKYSKYTFGSLI